MIRVCYVVDAGFLGGAEMYVSRLAGALDRRRFSPRVVMRRGGDSSLAHWRDQLRAQDIPVSEHPMRLPFQPWDAIGLWRELDAGAPHVVHVNMPGPYDGQMGLVLPLAKAAGARTVVTEHLPMVRPAWKRAAVKRLALRSLDVAVTMTRANAGLLASRQGIPGERIQVVPNGVRRSFGTREQAGGEQRWALGLRDTHLVLIYVGNILIHKGLRRLIDAMSKSVHRDALRLLVVGTGPDEGACRQLAADRHLSEQITFLGWRDSPETENIMASADVLALPSQIEGMPYVLLEAMASRLPVIAGDVFGVGEVVEDGVTGLLVDPVRTDAIAGAIDRLADDADLRERMGHAARERFERDFTLEAQVRRMENLYEALLHGSVARKEPDR